MPIPKDDNIKENIDFINQKIAEIKKKIQLSEGQRKAHFEECDAEKKRNIEKIRFLKKDVKELYKKIAEPNNCEESILKTSGNYPRDIWAIRNKKLDDAIHLIDLKCIDLNKQLDIYKYRNKMKKFTLKRLAEEFRDVTSKRTIPRRRKVETNSIKPMCILENQIHRTEMNMMEAEHINKKYKTIRAYLLSDSALFESSLRKLEEKIKKQNFEIQHLQTVNKEALTVRDITKGTLMRQEISALNAGKLRESQLQEFRNRVDERKLELERLEKHMFPSGRMIFDEGMDGNVGDQPNENILHLVNQLEAALNKLKAATGETETKDVLSRFLSQKETKKRLDFLKKGTEEEKKKLELKKEKCFTKLEASKFADAKENEGNQEEMEKMKQDIEFQKELILNSKKEYETIEDQVLEIGKCFYYIVQELCEINNEMLPELPNNVMDYIHVLDCLIRMVKSGLSQLGLGFTLQDTLKNLEKNEFYQQFINTNPLEVLEKEQPLFPKFFQQCDFKQVKSQQTSLLCQDIDDEEDIPGRNFLKRQSQLIVDAKSRKKFNRVLNFPKSKK